MSGNAEDSVAAWLHGGVLFESYRYTPGPVEAPPKHSHEEYQFGLSLNTPGQYRYRGGRHPVPVGSFSAIQSGEVHRSRDADFSRIATYRMLYVEPDVIRRVAAEVSGQESGESLFPTVAIRDKGLVRTFLELSRTLEQPAFRLERDSLLLSTLGRFVGRHADTRSTSEPAVKERRAVRLIREYLQDNYRENVSLDELAQRVDLSPYYLNRVFSGEVGIPPHQYQLQVRINRARIMLAGGTPVVRVAEETGFADQSHFTRHFKRFVGVPPGRYTIQTTR